jgi:hypothetical protein
MIFDIEERILQSFILPINSEERAFNQAFLSIIIKPGLLHITDKVGLRLLIWSSLDILSAV